MRRLTLMPWWIYVLIVFAFMTLMALVLSHFSFHGGMVQKEMIQTKVASGSSIWVGVPLEQRRYYLDDLFGQPWQRNSTIADVTKTRFHGLNRAQVLDLLGPTPGDASPKRLSYLLGDVGEEDSVFDKLISATTMDSLVIYFDPSTGLVVEIRITS